MIVGVTFIIYIIFIVIVHPQSAHGRTVRVSIRIDIDRGAELPHGKIHVMRAVSPMARVADVADA